jgi:hypothetical protein
MLEGEVGICGGGVRRSAAPSGGEAQRRVEKRSAEWCRAQIMNKKTQMLFLSDEELLPRILLPSTAFCNGALQQGYSQGGGGSAI